MNSDDVAALDGLEFSLRAALAALHGPGYAVVGRRVQPGPSARVSVTSLEALSIHLGQVVAALAELRGELEQAGPVPTITERKRRRS